MQPIRGLAVAGLGILGLAPAAWISGPYTPLAGLLTLALLLIARFVPLRERLGRFGSVLDALCALATAGVLLRGIGDYLVPMYPSIAGLVVLAMLGAVLAMRGRCPRVLLWFAVGFGALVLLLYVGAGLGIAAPAQAESTTNPGMLVVAALLLLASAAPLEPGAQRGAPWYAIAAALGFAVLAFVTLRQLGGTRTGLSSTPMVDAIRVAEADALVSVVVVALVLVLAVGAFGQLLLATERAPLWVPLLGAAAVLILGQFIGLFACAVFVVARFAYRAGPPKTRELT